MQVRQLKSRGPGRRPGLRQVGDLVSDKIDLSRHVEIDLAGLRHVCDFFVESRFLSKIEVVEFRNDKRTFRGSQPISSQLVMT